jgi:hypothetical protein
MEHNNRESVAFICGVFKLTHATSGDRVQFLQLFQSDACSVEQ